VLPCVVVRVLTDRRTGEVEDSDSFNVHTEKQRARRVRECQKGWSQGYNAHVEIRKLPLPTAADLRKDLRLYGRYCEKITLRAQALGNAVATHWFVTMLNPAYRGPAFRWHKLADMAVSHACTSAWSSFTDREWKTFKPLILEDVERVARMTATELLRESAVETWLPLDPEASK